MKFTKFMAIAGAVTIIASAVPAAMVNADLNVQDFIEYRFEGENAIITGIKGDGGDSTLLEIPESVNVDGKDYTVVGVDDFALVKLANLAVIYAPDSLKLENMGNVAFLTGGAVSDYVESEIGKKDITEEDALRYAAAKVEYKGGKELTDAELEEFSAKLDEQLEIAGVSFPVYDTISSVMVPLYKHLDELTVSDKTKDKIELWISSIPYNGITVVANEESDAAKYAKGFESLGMKYSTRAVLGDANLDGELTIRDAAHIAKYIAQKKDAELPSNADYNQDGKVNVRDAAAIANFLAHREKK